MNLIREVCETDITHEFLSDCIGSVGTIQPVVAVWSHGTIAMATAVLIRIGGRRRGGFRARHDLRKGKGWKWVDSGMGWRWMGWIRVGRCS